MSNLISREDFLSASDIKIEEIAIDEIKPGAVIYVRGMSGTERDSFEASILEMHGKKQVVNSENIRAKIVVRSACDQTGKLLFTEKDVAAIGKKSALVLTRMTKAAQRLSGIGDEDIDELTEGIKKNPLEGSSSD